MLISNFELSINYLGKAYPATCSQFRLNDGGFPKVWSVILHENEKSKCFTFYELEGEAGKYFCSQRDDRSGKFTKAIALQLEALEQRDALV